MRRIVRNRAWWLLVIILLIGSLYWYATNTGYALNIASFKDTISDSRPGVAANHTLDFTLQSSMSAGGSFDINFPTGFSVLATTSFSERNVELYVNGTPRLASSTLGVTTDQIQITTGDPGTIRYNLNPTNGIGNGARLEFRIGNHTSQSLSFQQTYSTSSGTTTVTADVPGVVNSSTTGTHRVSLRTSGTSATTYADFIIFLVEGVGVGPVNTFEDIPPLRFNGAPTSTVGGTTLNVELSVETDELATCRYSTSPGVNYFSMSTTFDNTGLLVHSEILTNLTSNTTYNYYVRCIDDEGNFNIDDFLINFTILPTPTGDPNEDGTNEGDGSGTGDNPTGSESEVEGGDENSGSGGGAGDDGSSSGGGGGGGGGGGSGSSDGDDEPGGFESGTPYESGDAKVIINGYAFPGSEVVALVDGFIAERVDADSNGKFAVTIDAIARGSYTFGVYAIDSRNVKSSTFSTTFTVAGGRTSSLSNINVMPSISVTPDPVEPGDPITVSGYALPNATITIENEKDKVSASRKSLTTTSNASGLWTLTIPTTGFSSGTYKIRAKAEQVSGVKTNFSDYTFYGVGEVARGPLTADLNRDSRVNLVDFSILLFWWGGDGGSSNPPADINGDGSVSLTDFSIMLFNWSG